jgi:hypothetical protein
MALLSESLPYHGKSALDSLKRIGLQHLHRSGLLASQLDSMTRPAITTVEQSHGSGHLRGRGDRHNDIPAVDRDRDSPSHRLDELIDGVSAMAAGEPAHVGLKRALR